jgi:hypothetical protein
MACLLNANTVKPGETAIARERLGEHNRRRQWLSSRHVMAVRHARNNRRSAGSGVLCAVRAESIYNEDQLPLPVTPRCRGELRERERERERVLRRQLDK